MPSLKANIQIPSKTFLLGEYFVLNSGRALLCNTTPIFSAECITDTPLNLNGLHPDSPAGKLLRHHDIAIAVACPHQGRGGFGASTAQFLAGYYAIHGTPFDLQHLLDSYRDHAHNGNGTPPSGADLMGQTQGGLCLWDEANTTLENLDWPFADLAFVLCHTGHKLATHEHLRSLEHLDTHLLEAPFEQAITALKSNDDLSFVNAVNAYQDALIAQGLTAQHTHDLRCAAQEHPAIVALKGCGAMGADVVAIFYDNADKPAVLDWVRAHRLQPVATQDDLAFTTFTDNIKAR
jgi:mevalonate kinase